MTAERPVPVRATGAIVIGGYVTGLAVVRSLGALGVPVAVVTTSPHDVAHRSRWCDERADVAGAPRFDEAVRALLERNAGRWEDRVVFPTNDPALVALAGLHDDLPGYRLAAPPLASARAMLRKDTLRSHAHALGIATPFDYGPVEPGACERDDLRFPVVVEPVERHAFAKRFGCKLVLARDRGALRAAVRRVAEAGLAARLVDFVPGGDEACYGYGVYLDAHGSVTAGLGMRTLRKDPPGLGVARVAAVWPEESLREGTVALLRRIGCRGIGYAEYKHDPRDGTVRLIDVDGRPFPTLGLARRAGVDLVRLAWEEMTGTPFGPAAYDGWRGHWIHLHADVLATLRFRRREALTVRDYVRPYLGPKAYAVWSLADPLPFAAQWSRTLRAASRLSLPAPGATG